MEDGGHPRHTGVAHLSTELYGHNLPKQFDVFDDRGYKVGTAQQHGAGWPDVYVNGRNQPIVKIEGHLASDTYDIQNPYGRKTGELREQHDPFIDFVGENSGLIGILVMIDLAIAAIVAVVYAIVWAVTGTVLLVGDGMRFLLSAPYVLGTVLAMLIAKGIGSAMDAKRLILLPISALLGAGTGWALFAFIPSTNLNPYASFTLLVAVVSGVIGFVVVFGSES